MVDMNQQNGYPNTIGNMQMNGGNRPSYNAYGNLMMNPPYDYTNQNRGTGMINQQQTYTNVNQNQYLRCRPVSSKEEARAFQIDLDGSLWVFTDIGNQKIYTKQINTDGTAAFKTYRFVQDETPYNLSNEFVTKEEFNKVIQTLAAAIQSNGSQSPVPAQNKPKEQLNPAIMDLK